MMDKEKLYVIGEVKKARENSNGTSKYEFIGGKIDEFVWLNDDSPALVRQSQLRYGRAKRGDLGFFENNDGLGTRILLRQATGGTPDHYLIIDSPTPAKPLTLAEWKAECPVCDDAVRKWIERMPTG